MPVDVIYPKVSLETSAGRISRWLVSEGAEVQAGQVLFEIENDKAAVEVEAPASGTIRALTPEGQEVEVGSAVARILAAGEMPEAVIAKVAAPVVTASAPFARADAGAPLGGMRGAGPNPTPLARRIARENGIILDGLVGSGPNGRVQRKDVLDHLAQPAAPAVPRAQDARPLEGLNGVWLRRGEGLPLVLLHGYSADLNNWRGMLIGEVAPPPAFALDLPGHGASPHALPADLDEMAEQVEARLAVEGIGPALLVGHSFGAALATRIAARGRTDARGLCLFSPAGLGPEINPAFVSGILRARTAASLRPWLELLVEDHEVISEAFLRAVTLQRQDEALTAAMTAFAARFFPDGTQSVSIRGDLARLEIPCRVIFGRQDRILPFGATAGLPDQIALHGLAGCGHMPHLEKPALARRILAEMRRALA